MYAESQWTTRTVTVKPLGKLSIQADTLKASRQLPYLENQLKLYPNDKRLSAYAREFSRHVKSGQFVVQVWKQQLEMPTLRYTRVLMTESTPAEQ